MKTIDDYFSSLTRFLRKHKPIAGLEPAFPYQRITDHFGRVNARLHFFDGSYLDIDEMVRIEAGTVINPKSGVKTEGSGLDSRRHDPRFVVWLS